MKTKTKVNKKININYKIVNINNKIVKFKK